MIWQQANLVRPPQRAGQRRHAARSAGIATLWTALGGLPAAELPPHAAMPATRSAWRIWPGSAPAPCRAARRSASRSRARWRSGRACCWPTSRSPASIPRRRTRSCACCAGWRIENGLAVLCVLHQVELAYGYADRIVGMRDGRVAFDLPRSEAVARDGAPALSPRGGMSARCASLAATPRLPAGAAGARAGSPLRSRVVIVLVAIAIVVQALIVVQARPQDLITGIHGMADIIRRAMPPDFSSCRRQLWPTLETVDIAMFGTVGGIVHGAAAGGPRGRNVTPSRYALLRGARHHRLHPRRARSGLGAAVRHRRRAGAVSRRLWRSAVHSIGMLGRLFAETIEHMDMAPIDALR